MEDPNNCLKIPMQVQLQIKWPVWIHYTIILISCATHQMASMDPLHSDTDELQQSKSIEAM